LAFSENAIIEQKHVIEDNLKQLKEFAKSAENQVAESREHLLKVKKEKKTLATQLKTVEDESGSLKIETENIKTENKKLIEDKKNLVREAKELKADQATLEHINISLEQKLERKPQV
jgi:chromosome segregation ATPase